MDENLKQITEWNEKNPIGTKVRVTNQNYTSFETTTTGEATLLGIDVVVVWVDHEYGCRLLRFVEAI